MLPFFDQQRYISLGFVPIAMELELSFQLQQILTLQQQIQDIHPFLGKLFPVAIVMNNKFFIYDIEPTGQQYIFVKQAPTPVSMSSDIRAAFPLESYDNQIVCVVTANVFDESAGYVTIFHEFIHCQQYEICEQKLKQTLTLARKAQAAHNYMWELNHPFPYQAPDFVQTYTSFLQNRDLEVMMVERQRLQKILNQDDYEYMVWQEWKEGLARFIENQIRQRLDLPANHKGQAQPYNRISFYAGGANFIKALGEQEPQLTVNIENLFNRMFQG